MKANRNVTLDVAKGLVLLTLPIIHSTLFYSTSTVQNSIFGNSLAFIAENAAPVFMLTMGVAISIGRKKTPRQILKRSFKLLLLGYLLNFLKFVLPMLWNGLPTSLFTENSLTKDFKGILSLFLLNDILQLAAISYLVCTFLYKLKKYPLWAAISTLIIIGLSPLIWQIQTDNKTYGFFLAFFSGQPPVTFFPVFPWLAYSLSGLTIGYLIKNFPEKMSFNIIFASGLALIGLSLYLAGEEPRIWSEDFYRLGPAGSFFHIGLALTFLYLCRILINIQQFNSSQRILTILSTNVTIVFILQWVLVCWLLPIFGYHHLELKATILASTLTTTLMILLIFLYNNIIKNLQGKPLTK